MVGGVVDREDVGISDGFGGSLVLHGDLRTASGVQLACGLRF